MKKIILLLISIISFNITFSQNELPDLTDKIKKDEKGRKYIETPNGRTYLYDSPVSNYDIMKKAAEENILPKEWLQNSPIHYKAADGYSTNMDYETLIDPQKREKFLAKEQAKHLQSQIHVGLVFIIAIIFVMENPLKVVPLIHSNLTPVKFSHSPFCLFLFSSYSSCPLCRVLH